MNLFCYALLFSADSFFDDADEEDMDEVDEDKEEEKSKKGCQLLQYILTTLTKCFLYDADQFVNKDRFDCLMQPLVDQVRQPVYPNHTD